MATKSDTAGSGGSTGQSSSLSAMLSTLVPVVVQAAVFVGIFLVIRTKYHRVYRPRTYLQTLHEEEKTKPLPEGRFNWLTPFRTIPDEYVFTHQSLDGYLYLRFLKMLTIICFVGACMTFPVLFPVNATGGGGQKELDLLSFSNIGDTTAGKNRYYAHAILGWMFFSFVMFVITRETIYYINLRNMYLLAPFNAARISSRTVLFTQVPAEYLNHAKLQQLFGPSLIRAWIGQNCEDLEEQVEEREKTVMKLEAAEIKLSQLANKRRLKWEKKNQKTKEPVRDGADEESASLASKWQLKKDRPTHRLGKIPLIGKKVDTIEHSRSELRENTPKIEAAQRKHLNHQGEVIPAVFVEFRTQQAAEAVHRRMTSKKFPKFTPRAIGVSPEEIIWKNLKLKKSAWKLRKFGTTTFIVLMILFWSIPVAVIGAISNINYLTNLVPFLSFINNIPKKILGVVTGLLPSLLLTILMALVPIICRLMAKLGGEVTLPGVEMKTQHWYMAFQVVQVFLVSTFSSGAASVVTQIIDEPMEATTLLAENLPKASNFFISYFIIQGLSLAAGSLLNIGSLIMIVVVGKILDKSPRKMFKRYITLAGLGWGSLYPRICNLGVIAIAYSIIAPLVLGFATIGFGLIWLASRYNSLYVLTNNVDTRGAAYGRALQQLMCGVYISEICLIGLFAINTAPGPIAIMGAFLFLTIIYHTMMRNALKPLTRFLPDTLDGDNQLALFAHADINCYDAKKSSVPPSDAEVTQPTGFAATKAKLFAKIFDPRKFASSKTVASLVPNFPPPQYTVEDEDQAYYNPAIIAPRPIVWIVRDEMGISRQEVRDSSPVVEISDEFATFDEKNKVVWDEERVESAPIYEKRVDY